MRFPTYLVRRGGVFYYRAKVPLDLIDQVKRLEVCLRSLNWQVTCAELVRLAGIEPTTLGFGGQYSIH